MCQSLAAKKITADMKWKHKMVLTILIIASMPLVRIFNVQNEFWQLNIIVAFKNIEGQNLEGGVQTTTTQAHSTLDQLEKINFTIKPSFRLPVYKNYSCDVGKVLQSDWVSQLQLFANSLQRRALVNMLTASYPQRLLVINWLVSAQLKPKDKLDPEPLQNILVVTTDHVLNQFLESRSIPSIYVPAHTVLRMKSMPVTLRLNKVFALQMVGLTVMRLLCHWGIDVAHFKPGALVLKNPHRVYNRHLEADVLGGYDDFPPHFFEMWSATLSSGSWMVRSTPATESFWNEVGETLARLDQQKINIACERMKVTPLSIEYDHFKDWRVLRGKQSFVVKIVPLNLFCINAYCEKEKKSKYYIWNKLGIEREMKNAGLSYKEIEKELKDAGLWFLKENWLQDSNLRGLAWLKQIAH